MNVACAPSSATDVWGVPADDEVSIVDVVDGADRRAADELVVLHRAMFPDYGFVADEIVADGNAAPLRDSLIVHQWLARCDGRPAGFALFDTNLARRVAVIHFLAIERSSRAVRLDGRRLASWLCRRVQARVTIELREHAPRRAALGVFGESPEYLVRRWHGAGFRRTHVHYAEPVAGRHWRDGDGSDPAMRPLALLWMPPLGGADPDRLAHTAAAAGAAAFLIDHYALPLDHPTVVATTGRERLRPGGSRDVATADLGMPAEMRSVG